DLPYDQSKSADGQLKPSPTSTTGVATDDTIVQDDESLLDTVTEVEHLNSEAVMFYSSKYVWQQQQQLQH
ncbi:hypothetical protein BGZ65_010055, partial [Modicella reniformis]